MSSEVLDRLFDPFTDCLTPDVARRIAEMRPDSATEERLQTLREKATEGHLTPAEREEYEEIVESLDVFGILKAKARGYLVGHAP